MNRGAHILLVDDDADERFFAGRALRKALSARGTIAIVSSGNEAIAYLIGEGEFKDRVLHPFPSAVITDLHMADGDGFDVLEFMQHNREWSVVPRIICSSSDDPDDVRTAYFLGVSAYHLKPSNETERAKTMRHIIDYWSRCAVPPVDVNGRLLITNSTGRPGARYPQKKGAATMRRLRAASA